MVSGADNVLRFRENRGMPLVRLADVEPSSTLRIARACTLDTCGTVYYVASIADGVACPVCGGQREDFDLSA